MIKTKKGHKSNSKGHTKKRSHKSKSKKKGHRLTRGTKRKTIHGGGINIGSRVPLLMDVNSVYKYGSGPDNIGDQINVNLKKGLLITITGLNKDRNLYSYKIIINRQNFVGWINMSAVDDINENLQLSKQKNNIRLISFNVYFRLMEPANSKKLDNIKEYLSKDEIKPDILFTQESYFDLPKKHFNNYTRTYFSSPRKSAISIHFNNSIFKLNGKIVKLGLSDIKRDNPEIKETNFKVDNIIEDNTGKSSRPMIAVKLTHKPTNKNIIFVSIWAPHHIVRSSINNVNNIEIFYNALNKVIAQLYTGNERIIIGGDFNEFYEESKQNVNVNVETIELDNNITLYLKQRKNTCCGSTDVSENGGLFEGYYATRPFDLLYDSEANKSDVSVGTNRMSDHLPIIADINI